MRGKEEEEVASKPTKPLYATERTTGLAVV